MSASREIVSPDPHSFTKTREINAATGMKIHVQDE
jgi:hypothetical protein